MLFSYLVRLVVLKLHRVPQHAFQCRFSWWLQKLPVGCWNNIWTGIDRIGLQAEPPELGKIPEEDIIGVTVLLLTCSYVGQEFIRVGYYVSNEYIDESLREEPPAKVLIHRVQRNILADKPRVTKFPIVFNSPPPPSNPVTDSNEAVRPMEVDMDMDQ